MSFIGLTYLHLTAALILTAVSSEYPLPKSPFVTIAEVIALFVIIFMLTAAKPGPYKYVLFAAFCLLIGQLISSKVDKLQEKGTLRNVLASVGGIFVAMSVVGFLDNQNILGFGGYLFAALVGLIIARIALMVADMAGSDSMDFTKINTLLNWFATILFSFYVAYDTQRLKDKTVQRGKDYVDASLGLFLDILNLFSSMDD
jgi:FtsH-binding integral membrane protein